MRNRTLENLKYRIEMLRLRASLLEQFSELGFKQADVSRITGQDKANVSLYFSGRNDSPEIEGAIKSLIAEKGVAI